MYKSYTHIHKPWEYSLLCVCYGNIFSSYLVACTALAQSLVPKNFTISTLVYMTCDNKAIWFDLIWTDLTHSLFVYETMLMKHTQNESWHCLDLITMDFPWKMLSWWQYMSSTCLHACHTYNPCCLLWCTHVSWQMFWFCRWWTYEWSLWDRDLEIHFSWKQVDSSVHICVFGYLRWALVHRCIELM